MAKRKPNELKVRKTNKRFELYSDATGVPIENEAIIKVNQGAGDDGPVATVILKIPLDG